MRSPLDRLRRWRRTRTSGLPAAETNNPSAPSGLLSVLTSAYNTSPALLSCAAKSLLEQSEQTFEWVLLDNGSTDEESRRELQRIAQDGRVILLRAEQNLGILGGIRKCLESASGRYVLPFDSDDELAEGALATITRYITNFAYPGFLYSDEAILVDGKLRHTYARPDWDPVLNVCTSYIFHLCAFDRERALALGVYSDAGASHCHDWDTVMRFWLAGHAPVHIPEVLYFWRSHARSATNQDTPASESIASQEKVLARFLFERSESDRFTIERFPINRGAEEPWIRHRKKHGLRVACATLVGRSNLEACIISTGATCSIASSVANTSELREFAAGLSADELVVVSAPSVTPEGEEWIWEAATLLELHRDAAYVAGRLLNDKRIVIGGGNVFRATGIECPDIGRPEHDAGPFAFALKQRSVGAPDGRLFIGRAGDLCAAIARMPAVGLTPAFLGAWVGAHAWTRQRRVAFSPLVQASIPANAPRAALTTAEWRVLRHAFPDLPSASHWYPDFT